MKRHDDFRYIESVRTGVKTFDLYPDEWKNYFDNPLFKVVVRCRRCGAHHDMTVSCWCCDLETKVKEI